MVLLVVEQVLTFSVGVYISQAQKLKFSMQPGIYLTHLNTIFEYYHVSVNLDHVDVFCLKDANVYTQS